MPKALPKCQTRAAQGRYARHSEHVQNFESLLPPPSPNRPRPFFARRSGFLPTMSAGSSDASSCSTPRLHLTTPAVPPAPAPLPFDCALWPPRRPITARRPHCPAPLAPLPSLPLPMLLLPDRAHAAAALCVHSRRSRYLMPRRGSTVLARLCAPAAPLALYVAVDVTRAAHGYYSHLAAPIRRKTHAQLTNAPSAAPGAAGTGSRLGSQKQTKHPEASWPARGGLSS